jgi:hypothetical protein
MFKAKVVTDVRSKFVNKYVFNIIPYQILSRNEHKYNFVYVAVMGVEPTLGIGL